MSSEPEDRNGQRIFILHRDVDFEFGYVVAVGVTLDEVTSKIPKRDDPREYHLEDWRAGTFVGEASFNIHGELQDWIDPEREQA